MQGPAGANGVTAVLFNEAFGVESSNPIGSLNFDSTPANNNRLCPLGPYTPTQSQTALIDVTIAFEDVLQITGSANVVYSTDNGTTWTAILGVGNWATAPSGTWASSTRATQLALTANTTYLFAVVGFSTIPPETTADNSTCSLRITAVNN